LSSNEKGTIFPNVILPINRTNSFGDIEPLQKSVLNIANGIIFSYINLC
jgi:hypothetical protein